MAQYGSLVRQQQRMQDKVAYSAPEFTTLTKAQLGKYKGMI
jgi:hypothetical protein